MLCSQILYGLSITQGASLCVLLYAYAWLSNNVCDLLIYTMLELKTMVRHWPFSIHFSIHMVHLAGHYISNREVNAIL